MESLGKNESRASDPSYKDDNSLTLVQSVYNDVDMQSSVVQSSVNDDDKSLSIDEMLTAVGEYGRFQKMVNVMFCAIMFPSVFPLVLPYFVVKNPRWRCAPNSTFCRNDNDTFSSTNSSRCEIPRTEWEYVTPRSYSIVTEFDLVCDNEYLIELQTSIFFRLYIRCWCYRLVRRQLRSETSSLPLPRARHDSRVCECFRW